MSSESRGQSIREGAAGMALPFSTASWASAGPTPPARGWTSWGAGFASVMASLLTSPLSGPDGCQPGVWARPLGGLAVPAQGDPGLRAWFPGRWGRIPRSDVTSPHFCGPRRVTRSHTCHLRVRGGDMALTCGGGTAKTPRACLQTTPCVKIPRQQARGLDTSGPDRCRGKRRRPSLVSLFLP